MEHNEPGHKELRDHVVYAKRLQVKEFFELEEVVGPEKSDKYKTE